MWYINGVGRRLWADEVLDEPTPARQYEDETTIRVELNEEEPDLE